MHRERTLAARADNRRVESESETSSKRDIFYLDAHKFTRHCITRELARRLPEFNILAHAAVEELVASAESCLDKAAVAILYVRADPGGDTGQSDIPSALNTLEQLAPNLPRVLLSEVEVPEDIVTAFHQRVRGYMPTSLPIDQVAEAVRFVAAGGTFVPQSILSLHTRSSGGSNPSVAPAPDTATSAFSPRQTDILRMLWKGHSNKLIAYELRMCESTVKVHIRHIMKKLKANNRTQVVLRTRPQLLSGDASIGAMGPDHQDCSWIDTAGNSSRSHAPVGLPDQTEACSQSHGSRRNDGSGV